MVCPSCHTKSLQSSYPAWRQSIGWVVVIAQVLFVAVNLVLLHKRHMLYPLSARSRLLLTAFALNTLLSLWWPIKEIVGEAGFSCDLQFVLPRLNLSFISLIQLLRVLRVYRNSSFQTSLRTASSGSVWRMAKLKAKAKPVRDQVMVASLWLLPMFILVFLRLLTDSRYLSGLTGCAVRPDDFLSSTIYRLMFLGGLLGSLAVLKGVKVGFSLKRELRILIALGFIIYVLLSLFVQFVDSQHVSDGSFYIGYLPWLYGFIGICLQISWPLAISWSEKSASMRARRRNLLRRARLRHVGLLLTLEEVLADRAGMKAFTAFLKQEWSSENIYFWRGVRHFRSKYATSPKAAMRIARTLMKKFVRENSLLQVNLPARLRISLEATFDEVEKQMKAARKRGAAAAAAAAAEAEAADGDSDSDSGGDGDDDGRKRAAAVEGGSGAAAGFPLELTVFDDAQTEIFMLMNTDSFPRFLESDLYRKLNNDNEQRRMAVLESADDGSLERLAKRRDMGLEMRSKKKQGTGLRALNFIRTSIRGGRSSSSTGEEAELASLDASAEVADVEVCVDDLRAEVEEEKRRASVLVDAGSPTAAAAAAAATAAAEEEDDGDD
eukprot:PLAT5375.1.p1 GENE.PLAT5375.1~~PLAT5375.1.p1  ORF type:complete len:607 (-),score=304.90 PLAT5375.1:69-1889(-)